MGKSSKKSEAPAVIVPKMKAGKKREAEDEIEKVVSMKKAKAAPAKAVAVPKAAGKNPMKQPLPKKAESSSSEEESEEEVKVQQKKTANAVKHESSDGSSGESCEDEKPVAPVKKPSAKESESSESDSYDEFDENVPAKSKAPDAATTKSDSSDNSSSNSVSEDEGKSKKASFVTKNTASDKPIYEEPSQEKQKAGKAVSDSSHFGQDSGDCDDEDEKGMTRTVFVGNLPFSADVDQVKHFFCDVSDAVVVRLPTKDGQRRGFGYVEFGTVEDAVKALALNGRSFMDRVIRLDMAFERSSRAPKTREGGYYGKPIVGPNLSVYVKGFDTAQPLETIESSLQEYFSRHCGEITSVRVPVNHQTGETKGWAFIDFKNEISVKRALLLKGGGLGGKNLHVAGARPGSGGGWSAGRDGGGRFGRSGGRDGGGRFGRSGGRDGGKRGGQVFQSRQSAGTLFSGKKTTFDND